MFKNTLPVAASHLQVKVASKEVNLMAPAALQGVRATLELTSFALMLKHPCSFFPPKRLV